MFKKSHKTPDDLVCVGIWLHEIYPGGFTGEGISRLIAWIILSTKNRPDIRFKVACVAWVKEPFRKHLADLGVDVNQLEFITVPGVMPLLYKIYQWGEGRLKKPKARRQSMDVSRWLKAVSIAVFSRILQLPLILSLPLLLLGSVLIIGVELLRITLFLAFRIARNLFKMFQTHVVKYDEGTAGEGISNYKREKQGRFRQVLAEKISNRVGGYAKKIYHLLIRAEWESLSRKASRDKKVNCWFFIYPKNPYIAKFKTPTVLAVADVVYLDFPTPFARELPGMLMEHKLVEDTIRSAGRIITYSEFVRDSQVVRPGYQPIEKVTVIRHAPIETRPLIEEGVALAPIQLKHRAVENIRAYLEKLPSSSRENIYLKALPFGDFDYLFVSSQTRAHKNHMNFIKAYETLLREKYINIKLIFTGTFSAEFQQYIWDRKLHLDVLSIPGQPAKVHASFYACARLAVAPTLFEGGFTGIFTEALSVGTPAIVSDIPVAQELLNENARKMICFDPYNTYDMIQKTCWALENTNELLRIENDIYIEMQKRTWDDVAGEYIDVFKTAVAGAKT